VVLGFFGVVLVGCFVFGFFALGVCFFFWLGGGFFGLGLWGFVWGFGFFCFFFYCIVADWLGGVLVGLGVLGGWWVLGILGGVVFGVVFFVLFVCVFGCCGVGGFFWWLFDADLTPWAFFPLPWVAYPSISPP